MPRRWIALLLLTLWMALPAMAQPPGQLRVLVSADSDELPIPGATLRLTGDALVGGSQERQTNSSGEVLFAELPADTYTLVVVKQGFQGVTVEQIVVSSGQTAVVTVRLGSHQVEEICVQVASGKRTRPSSRYLDSGVNPIELTQSDRLSTFAIDVDTGSYTMARRALGEGHLPDPASVRVEEFVNAIRYDYGSAPAATVPFAVDMEALPHPLAPDRKVLLRVALQGTEVPRDDRAPLHLTFLVDVSGSMDSPDRLPLAQQALHHLVENLGPEDRVAIATYAGSVRRVLEPTWTTQKPTIHAAIDDLSAGGGTGMNDGMTLAYEMAEQMFLEGAENRVVVLSDGDANIGPSTHAGILRSLSRWAGRGITMSTVGFGMGNYKDALMEQLADKGDGNYAYVDSLREAERLFGHDLGATLITIARDVKVQVEFPPETVLAYRLLGYENRDVADVDFRKDDVDGGEIGSGHQVTALYELDLQEEPGAVLARVHVRAKPPGRDRHADEHVTAIATRDILGDPADASASTRLAFGVATFAERLLGSPHVAEVSWEQVLDLVRDHDEVAAMVRSAAAL